MKNLFKAAHKMTREMVAKYKDIDYKAQFVLCLAYLQENKEEKEVKGVKFGMVEGIKVPTEILTKNQHAVINTLIYKDSLTLTSALGNFGRFNLNTGEFKPKKESYAAKRGEFYAELNDIINFIYVIQHFKKHFQTKK